MNTTETKNKHISKEESHLPKFKTIDDSLFIFSIRLMIKNLEKESIYLQNLIKTDSEKDKFRLDPKLYGNDLKLEFLDKNMRIDMRMPALVFDSIDYDSNDNAWKQLRNSIKEILNIDISNAKIGKLNFALFESVMVKKLFDYKFEIDGFSLEEANQRYRKFVRNDKELEYLLSSYTSSKNIVNEEIVLKKNHKFLQSYSYSDFMNSYMEDEMREIILECRMNLKIQN